MLIEMDDAHLTSLFDIQEYEATVTKSSSVEVSLWNKNGKCLFLNEFVRSRFHFEGAPSEFPLNLLIQDLDRASQPPKHENIFSEIDSFCRGSMSASGSWQFIKTVFQPVQINSSESMYLALCTDITESVLNLKRHKKTMEVIRYKSDPNQRLKLFESLNQLVLLYGFSRFIIGSYNNEKKYSLLYSSVTSSFESESLHYGASACPEVLRLFKDTLEWQKNCFLHHKECCSYSQKNEALIITRPLDSKVLRFIELKGSNLGSAYESMANELHYSGIFKNLLESILLSHFDAKVKIDFAQFGVLSVFDLNDYNFSQRQLKILEMLYLGSSNKEISHAINISEQGVKYHVGSIFRKFAIKNRSQLKTQLQKLRNLRPNTQIGLNDKNFKDD